MSLSIYKFSAQYITRASLPGWPRFGVQIPSKAKGEGIVARLISVDSR